MRVRDEPDTLGRATRDADGTIRLHEHNCAIYGVSGTYQIACAAELQLFGEVLGAKVTREWPHRPRALGAAPT